MNHQVLAVGRGRSVIQTDAAAVAASRRVAEMVLASRTDLDADDAYPDEGVAWLGRHGLLTAPLPVSAGGLALGASPESAHALRRILSEIGRASLPLGRLYEGHVNALTLVCAYGTQAQIARVAGRTADGHLGAVWNTEGADGVRLCRSGDGFTLRGRKIYASGAGHMRFPLITARSESGELLMVLPEIDRSGRADHSDWTAQGMRASASGALDFSGLPVTDADILGGPDDFHRQPLFSAGAWRFAAVQLGGIARLVELLRAHLIGTGRDGDPHQRARFAEAIGALETAHLWVCRAAQVAAAPREGDAAVAYVNLARLAVERAGLDVIELAQRSIGLTAFMRWHEAEHVIRDLATYLRQPNPDKAAADAAAHHLGQDGRVLDELSRC